MKKFAFALYQAAAHVSAQSYQVLPVISIFDEDKSSYVVIYFGETRAYPTNSTSASHDIVMLELQQKVEHNDLYEVVETKMCYE